MSRLFQFLISTPVAVVLVILTGCEQEQAAPSFMPGSAAVTAVTLKAESVSLTRELPGRVTPFLVAEVRPQVTGIVKEQIVNEGSLVEAGQALFQLDDAIYQADYNSAVASLNRAKVALEIARINAERSEKLAETGTISKQNYDNSIALLHQAEADVGVAEAALASTKVVLEYARITAPISGRVGRSSVTRGALVTSNQDTPLVTVQQLDPIYIDLSQSANELLTLRRQIDSGTLMNTDNIPVTILLEDDSVYAHEGKLMFSDVTVDPTTGSYFLRVIVPNPDHILLPGMYVRAQVTSGKRDDALLVPQQGIARDPVGNATAMVISADNTVEPRQVQVSRTIGNKWLVDGGLSAGDRVIIEGLQKIMPGMPVEATEAAADSTTSSPTQ